MNSILSIARYTSVEQLRNRLYLIILFFGALILLISSLVGALAPSYKVRVIFDLGLVALELFGLITAVFGAVTLVIQEIESKTIYLILYRPIHRSSYILGRFLGLVAASGLTMIIMAVLHVIVMLTDYFWFTDFVSGWSFWTIYPLVVCMSLAKMFVTASLALFFSLFATSSVSALIFTGCFWIAGHFGPELSFMIRKSFSAGWGQAFVQMLAYALPNFQYLNFRDLYSVPQFPGYEFIGWAALYAFAYAASFLTLSSILFNRKEF